MTEVSSNLISQWFARQKDQPNNVKFWLTLFVFSCFALFAMGRVGGDAFAYGLWLYLSLYVLKRFSNKAFIVYLWFTFIVSVLYLPVALMYGEMSYSIAISLFETNAQESKEFLSSIEIKSYVAVILYVALFIYLLKINRAVSCEKTFGKGFYVLSAIVVLSIINQPIRNAVKSKEFKISQIEHIKYYPLRHIFGFTGDIQEYLKNKKALKKARSAEPVWDFASKEVKYDTYVLVIGESMRRDYMSMYGFPLETTPFLSKAPGTIFNNYIAPGQNTRLSLERMLFHNTAPEQSIRSNTPVTLANSLDMDTYWLSNQGIYGDYDVFASSVAVRSDKTVFLSQGDFTGEEHSDLELIPHFNKIMEETQSDTPDKKKKLIVMHLYGSHWDFCNRLDPNYKIENITNHVNKELSCYVSSYRQTDKLLETVYESLKKNEDSFSLMYLSDHGLVHKKRSVKGLTLRHDYKYKEDYEVPFMTFSSYDTKRTYINADRSGYYFMNAFAEWLGVTEKQLALEPQFFSDESYNKPIKVFTGEKVVDYESLDDDPAITDSNHK